jgi:hypothetical protein
VSNHKLGSPVRPPTPPAEGALHVDEDCPKCLHPAWAHRRAGDHSVWQVCIGVDCGCLVLAR